MKTFYKKLFIIAFSSLLLEVIIIYFLYTSINAFYADLTNKLAFLLVEQVQKVIAADNLKISQLGPYNKYPTRRLMNRFSGEDSKILHILLIDTTNRIVVSDDPTIEGEEYTSPEELRYLATNKPKIVNRAWEGNQEILDVIVPLEQDSIKQGYLRTVLSLKHLENFYQNRRNILIGASIISLAIIFLTVFSTSRIYQSSLREIETALENLHQSDYRVRLKFQKRDEFARLYNMLNQLFTEASKLREGFQESEERIDAMKRVIHEGMLITDMKKKIISYNDYLLTIFKVVKHRKPEVQIEQIMQKNMELQEIFRKASDPLTHSVRRRTHIKLLDDSLIEVQINASSIMEGDELKSVVFYFKNLASLKELELFLDRSLKYSVIHQLARSFGHEVRNPLSSLAIHTEILDNIAINLTTERGTKNKIQKSLKILASEIDRISRLMDGFIDLISPREVEFTRKNLNNIIKDIVELVQQEAQEKNIELTTQLTDNLPNVNVSQDQMKQVILNLLLNAFDAMPNGGKVKLKTAKSETFVSIMVEDSGMGIPAENRDRIFDFNFSTKAGSRGIGLHWSKNIVEEHSGKISFKSRVGEGTQFTIELPMA
jgi:signal transduction histidine kinase